jgi:hypothetical protein
MLQMSQDLGRLDIRLCIQLLSLLVLARFEMLISKIS